MRVFLNRRRGDERGAVMVIVTLLLASFLISLSAFTIDLGSAYVSKRNLQKAADAGALAAAQEFARFPGSCSTVLGNSVATNRARAAAAAYRDKNRASQLEASRELQYNAACVDGNIVVTHEVAGDTDSLFSSFFNTSPEIVTDRIAQAVVEVGTTSGISMRPLAVCSSQLMPGPDDPFVRLNYPRDAPAACGNASGSWWTVDCPGAASNSTSQMVLQVRNGCPKGASVVSGTSTSTPGDLTTKLEAACLGGETAEGGCLESNPGNLDSGQVADSWKYLVDNSTPAVFPVFCAPPQCTSTTIEGNGNNATFPVYKLLGAVVCGYHFSRNEKYHRSTGDCAGLPTSMYAGNDSSGNTTNYLIIKYMPVRASGSNQTAECILGALNCDGGVRRTRLVQ